MLCYLLTHVDMSLHVNLTPPPAALQYSGVTVTETVKTPCPVRHATGWASLLSTSETDETELVIWERASAAEDKKTFKAPSSDFEIMTGDYSDVLAGFEEFYETADWPDALRDQVMVDVMDYLTAFEAKFAGTDYRLRLQAIYDDACRKFHQDRTFQRLIISYRGPGTVWRYADETAEFGVSEMDCVLLRGKRDGAPTQILHRSPKHKSELPPRLVMVIDTLPQASCSSRTS